VAPPTRVSDYIDGGDAHFSVDREVAEQLVAAVPGGLDGFHAVGRAGQAFLTRVVRLAVDEGVRQFMVTGSKLSGDPNVHDIAQALAPESRVVYLVLDPMMLAFAPAPPRARRRSCTPSCATPTRSCSGRPRRSTCRCRSR
jgi:hypothetical protein